MSAPVKFVREVPRGGQFYMGEPDGPMRFVKSLGMEVPTFISPRDDLRTQYRNAKAHKNVDYHIPISKRGPYRPEHLADYDPEFQYPLTPSGVVRCGALMVRGTICQKSARNYTGFCSNHGGALHPADKLFVSERGIMPSDVTKMSRMQMVEMGIIKVSELTDEEIAKGAIRNDDGTFTPNSQLVSAKINSQMRTEFFERADRFIRENVMDMLGEMRRIALSPVEEAKDKIQAIQWLTERALGKTPDVLITNQTDKPFDQLLGDISGGSREEYRNSQRELAGGLIDGEFESKIIVDDEDYEDDEIDDENVADAEVADVPNGVQIQVIEGDVVEVDSSDIPESEGAQEIGSRILPVESPGDSVAESDSVEGRTAAQLGVTNPAEIAAMRKAQKDAIKRRRNKRYAARAIGATTLDDLPYHLVFKECETQRDGKFIRMKLVAPEDQKSPQTR